MEKSITVVGGDLRIVKLIEMLNIKCILML